MTHAVLYIMNEENVSDYMWSRRTKEIVNEIFLLCSLVQIRLAQSKVIPQIFLRIMQRIWENNIINRSQCLESKEYQHKKTKQNKDQVSSVSPTSRFIPKGATKLAKPFCTYRTHLLDLMNEGGSSAKAMFQWVWNTI